MKNRKKRNKIYLYLLVILGLTVGFALLSTTLNINGTAGIKKNTWDIHWDKNSIQVTENSVQAETPTVTEDGQKVSYEVTLELPGDFYEFTIDAVNAGTIDGMVNIGGLTPTIKNKTTGSVYKNFQKAMNEVNDNDELVMIDDATLYSELSIPNKKFTLDLNSHKIDFIKQAVNDGDVTILDNSTDKKGTATDSEMCKTATTHCNSSMVQHCREPKLSPERQSNLPVCSHFQ